MPTARPHAVVMLLGAALLLLLGAAAAPPPEAQSAAAPTGAGAFVEVARMLSAGLPAGAAYRVGQPEGGASLEGYAAWMLAAALGEAGVPSERLNVRPPRQAEELHPCLLSMLQAEPARPFVRAVVRQGEAGRMLRVHVYEPAAARWREPVQHPLALGEPLAAALAGPGADASPQDRRWFALLDQMLAPGADRGVTAAQRVAAAGADYLFNHGLWDAAADRYEALAPGRVGRLVARAVVSLQLAGRRRDASRLHEGILTRHPDSGPLYALGGWLALRQERADDALMMLEQARLVDMAHEGFYVYARGLVALERGDEAAAAQFLVRAADLLPDRAFAQVEAARLCWARGDAERALACYVRASGQPDAPIEARLELGMLLDAADRSAEALEVLQQAFRTRRDDPALVRQLALLLGRRGRQDEALQVLQLAAETDPCDPALLAAYGDGARSMWLIPTAEERYRAAISVSSPFPYAEVRLAEVLVIQRRYRDAQRVLTELLAAQPDYQPARVQLGLLLGGLGRTEEALSLLAQAARSPASEADARQALAEVHMGAGSVPQAVQEAQIAVSLRPDAPAYAVLARAFLEAGDLDKAQSAAASALGLAPRDEEGLLALARVRLRQERPEEALAYVEQALAANPYCAEALELLGELKQRGQDFPACAAAWQRALALNPWNARLHSELSRVLGERLGDRQAAVEHYARYLELERMRTEAPR